MAETRACVSWLLDCFAELVVGRAFARPWARNDRERTTKNLAPSLRGALAPRQSSAAPEDSLFDAGSREPPLYFVSGQPLSAAVGNALSPGTVAIIL
jgi:hypothetical protein